MKQNADTGLHKKGTETQSHKSFCFISFSNGLLSLSQVSDKLWFTRISTTTTTEGLLCVKFVVWP